MPKIRLHTTKVPLYPPFNTHQAETWTQTLWPVVFNPSAPRAIIAPPPQILNRAQDSIQARAGYYLALAKNVAKEAKQSGLGRGVGAVIVDPAIEAGCEATGRQNSQWPQTVVAVAGDARYSRKEGGIPSQAELHVGVTPHPASQTYNADLEGGPELHALMRGVELVAHRRRQKESLDRTETASAVRGAKLSPLESYFLYQVVTPEPFNHPRSPSSPKKRKHEAPNPESSSTTMDLTRPPPTTPELPAPPPSTTALPDPFLPGSDREPLATIAGNRIRTRSQGGYLCTDLDVYITHEPCLCCSMGMLLSRFRAVIFPRAGRLSTGGLASEPVVGSSSDYETGSAPVAAEVATMTAEEEGSGGGGGEREATDQDRLYYGLHWRKELNWRALGFEFVEDGIERSSDDDDEVVFHA